jgi:hypothetical protein
MSSMQPDDPIKLMAKPKWDEVESYKEKAKQALASGKPEEEKIWKDKAKDLTAKIKERGWVIKKNAVFKVIDRKSGRMKTMEGSPGLSSQISELAQSEWGDPQNYDINIKVDEHPASPAGWYTVTPAPGGSIPLTADELKLKESIDLADMKRRYAPPSTEKMIEMLAKARAKRAGSSNQTSSTVVPSYSPPTVTTSTPETNDDVSFEPAEIEG